MNLQKVLQTNKANKTARMRQRSQETSRTILRKEFHHAMEELNRYKKDPEKHKEEIEKLVLLLEMLDESI